jgi:iron(III) transport system ATP-binding protein
VTRKRFRGANILYTLQIQSNEQVLALISSHHNHSIGQEIGIRPQVDEIILFEAGQAVS